MGREIRCFAEVGDWTGEGRLLLETDELIFRGARRIVIARSAIERAFDDNGWLVVEHSGGRERFDLGRLAPAWVNAIVHPRSRIDKLDVKETSRAALEGAFEDDFIAELRARTTHIDESDTGNDIVFVRIDAPEELERLPALRQRIAPHGGIWVIHPKGDAALKHEVIVAAARAAGLVDNKSARFSATHAALRLVIPRKDRAAGG